MTFFDANDEIGASDTSDVLLLALTDAIKARCWQVVPWLVMQEIYLMSNYLITSIFH
jgi:hypothetical protein